MTNLFTGFIILAGIGLIISGLPERTWIKLILGGLLSLFSPILGDFIARFLDPKIMAAEKHRAEKAAKKAAEKEKQQNPDKIGFAYLKATFLFAGHIAHSDGEVCDSERQLFDNRCARLQLDQHQMTAARDYFNQGANHHFDAHQALKEFIEHCGHVPALVTHFIETQFAFAAENGEVTFAELAILAHLSERLNASPKYQRLLEEYRLAAIEKAESHAREKLDAHRRQRDKQREAAEKARLDKEAKEKLAQLTPAQRELRLAFAVLGIKATQDKATIKRAYRQQIKRHHPDYLLAQGYPDALLQEATERSMKINQAYRLLKKRLKFA